MICRRILTLGMAIGLGFVTTPSTAKAGFEFTPPKQVSTPVPSVQNPAWQAPQAVMPAMPAPMMAPSMPIRPPSAPSSNFAQPIASPPAPVIQAPLQAPVQMMAQPPAPVAMPPVTSPATPMARNSGLVIDPFPLRNNKATRLRPSDQAVATTMAETGGALTPVQLGAGMTTGVKADQLRGQNIRVAPRAPQRLAGATSLTPIPGGEPAPLPNVDLGITQAYRDPSVTQTKPMIFANAVGFANDIPMAIALEQIIPAGFQTNLSNGVSADNMMVSWEGGQPWNIVLNQMLRTHNLTANIQGQVVTIQPMARL